jgi:hypothetical protein
MNDDMYINLGDRVVSDDGFNGVVIDFFLDQDSKLGGVVFKLPDGESTIARKFCEVTKCAREEPVVKAPQVFVVVPERSKTIEAHFGTEEKAKTFAINHAHDVGAVGVYKLCLTVKPVESYEVVPVGK